MVLVALTIQSPLHKLYARKHNVLEMKTADSKKCPIIDHETLRFEGILVAAGRGERAGAGLPKQYRTFCHEPVFIHALRAFIEHPHCDCVYIVHPQEDKDQVLKYLSEADLNPSDRLQLVEGGPTRTASVRNGVEEAALNRPQAILIHDAARPGLDALAIDRLLNALGDHEGCAPALPVVDALKHWSGNAIQSVDRSNLFRIQTPQAFRTDSLLPAIRSAEDSYADEFELAEAYDLALTLVDGSERLAKLTYPEDFERLETLIMSKEIRTGLGYDVHAFEEGNAVILCGTEIAHVAKLKGHSDADVGWHALTDAILGAMAEGDIGDHFPPTDPQWKGAPSSTFLRHASDLLTSRGGRLLNIDLTLICESPKIKPHRQAMRQSTSELLGLDVGRISIKATTTEGLGFEGRREGIAAQAIATIELPAPRQDPQTE